MALRCLCGASYGTKEHLFHHAVERAHLYKCECGYLFGSQQAVNIHVQDAKHATTNNAPQRLSLLDEAYAPSVDPTSQRKCGLCADEAFDKSEQLDQHLTDKHHACPVCHQVLDSAATRLLHQRSMHHYYCEEHDQAFVSFASLALHKRKMEHVTGFECVVCDKSFQTNRALESHLLSEGHQRKEDAAAKKDEKEAAAAAALTEQEEKDLRCEACNRSFRTLDDLRKHRVASRKHKPLCELECPLSEACDRIFHSPSALLCHLESGKYKSGVTRSKLNAVVFKHDTDSQLTDRFYRDLIVETDEMQSSIASSSNLNTPLEDSLSHLSLDMNSITSGLVVEIEDDASSTASSATAVPLTPPASDLASGMSDGTTTFTPPGTDAAGTVDGSTTIITQSESDSADTSDESTIVFTPSASIASPALSGASTAASTRQLTPSVSSIADSAEVRYDPSMGCWLCTHPHCDRSFRTKWRLLKHMDSPVHLPSIFHCPTSLPGVSHSDDRIFTFKTLSGLVQHMEAGVCDGGQEGLRAVADVVENLIMDKTGRRVKLLD